jgi:hypothetical protein
MRRRVPGPTGLLIVAWRVIVLMVITASPGTEGYEKLQLLSVIGNEHFTQSADLGRMTAGQRRLEEGTAGQAAAMPRNRRRAGPRRSAGGPGRSLT